MDGPYLSPLELFGQRGGVFPTRALSLHHPGHDCLLLWAKIAGHFHGVGDMLHCVLKHSQTVTRLSQSLAQETTNHVLFLARFGLGG